MEARISGRKLCDDEDLDADDWRWNEDRVRAVQRMRPGTGPRPRQTRSCLDATAPDISAVAASGLTSSSATITWTTNEPASSQVNYGLTTGYGSTTALDPTPLTSQQRRPGWPRLPDNLQLPGPLEGRSRERGCRNETPPSRPFPAPISPSISAGGCPRQRRSPRLRSTSADGLD